MPGLVALELGVGKFGQLCRTQRGPVDAGVGDERGRELADEVGEGGTVEAEESRRPRARKLSGSRKGVPSAPPAFTSRIVVGSTRQLP